MTLRQPHQDAILPAADAAMIRQVLGACSDLITWAGRHCGPQFTAAAPTPPRPPASAAPPAPWPARPAWLSTASTSPSLPRSAR